ncbi:MAG: glycosyl transferase, partial [Gammaproteobacteria bacterium]|nr:glycosyl transferase [Gammaproteobacteria bacterium]
AKLEQVLLEWRDSESRLTRTHVNCTRDAFDQVRARYLSQDPRISSGRPLAFWGAGRKTRKRVSLLLDKGYQPCTWIDIDPRKIGNRINGIPVVAPEWLKREERPFVLSYVSNHGARELIAAELEILGYQRGMDYLMVG